MFDNRSKYSNYAGIYGLDEAGRGSLAGPIVGSIIGLTRNQIHSLTNSQLTIKDSKQLSSFQRSAVIAYLMRLHIHVKIAIRSVHYINTFGIQKANTGIFRELIANTEGDEFIVDGTIQLNMKHKQVTSVAHADATILPVMLAGIAAKCYRDYLMLKLHNTYPHYGFLNNKGYGTPEHIRALQIFGPSIQHRSRFVTTALQNTTRRVMMRK